MSCSTAFRATQGEIESFDRPFASGMTWKDVLLQENFRVDPCLILGNTGEGLHINVHPAAHANAPYQEFAFLVVIWLGALPHPVFCSDLAELLPLLRNLLPLVEFSLRTEGETGRRQPSEVVPSLSSVLGGNAALQVASTYSEPRCEQIETKAAATDTNTG